VNQQQLHRVLSLLFVTVLVLSGCTAHPSLNALDPQGTVGEKQLNLINWSLLLMVGVFAIVITIFIYVLIRYRKKEGEERMPEQVHGNTKLEIIWTVIPIIALIALAFPTVKYTFELDKVPQGEDVIEVKVKGHQYWWEFEYPELGIKTAQELVIPVNRKARIEIEGNDVLHSFWVPALGGKTDVVPGKKNTMWLDAKKPGTYQGKCAELCGPGHALMDFKVFAKSDTDFDKWVAMMKEPIPKTVSAIDKKGEGLYRQNCMGCHAGVNPKVKGPDLTKFGTRDTIAGILPHTEKDLRNWLKNPDQIKPGTRMPKIDYFQKDEMDAIIHYLMNRKPQTTP
jgi:cytochrome c oxidase subunit II